MDILSVQKSLYSVKKSSYDKILNNILGNIKYKSKNNIQELTYIIPEYTFGIPLISNKDECTFYIVDQLSKMGFRVSTFSPMKLYINWSNITQATLYEQKRNNQSNYDEINNKLLFDIQNKDKMNK